MVDNCVHDIWDIRGNEPLGQATCMKCEHLVFNRHEYFKDIFRNLNDRLLRLESGDPRMKGTPNG